LEKNPQVSNIEKIEELKILKNTIMDDILKNDSFENLISGYEEIEEFEI